LFLDHFGIRQIDDLPNAAELRRVKLPTAEETAPAGETPVTSSAEDTPDLSLQIQDPPAAEPQ
jgi:segregation and condensation protein B